MCLLSLAWCMPCCSQLPLTLFYGATAHFGPRTPPPHALTIRLLSPCDQPGTEGATYTTHNKDNRRTSMLPAGFEPVILAIKGLQTYALDRAATGFGSVYNYQCLMYTVPYGVRNFAKVYVFLKLCHSTYYWE